MFEPASPTMPGAFSPAAEPYGARHNNVYHPPTPSTAPQTPSTLGSSSYFFQRPAASPATMSRQNENQRPLFVNRKRSRQDTVTGAPPQLQYFGQDNDTIMRSSNTSSNYDTALSSGINSRNVSSTFNPDIPPSPMPFVNTQYALKGGLDTPTAQRAAYFEGDGNTESEFSDINYRRTLATGRRTASGRHMAQGGAEGFEREYHSFARLPSSASLESNGRPLITSPTNIAPSSPGWGKIAGGLAGGVVGGVAGALGTVVGKVWQFCKAGAFSGFNAGGGEGYQIDPKHKKEDEIADDFSSTQIEFPDPPPAYTPLSEYQEPVDESVCMVDYPTPETAASQRPAKRRQISHEAIQNNNDAAIERSWVVVPIPSVPSSPAPAETSNYCRNPRISNNPLAARYSTGGGGRPQSSLASPARATGGAPRPGQRRPMMHQRQSNSVSSTGSPRFIPPRPSTATASYASPSMGRPSTASYASPRSSFGASIATGGYQSRLPRPATPRSGATTPTATPTRSQIPLPSTRSGRNSVAGNRHTPRSSIGGGAVESPAAIEAKKWREQKKKEEAEEDIAMKRLNKQLQDMIREGQAALGTRFEVRDSAEGDEEMEDY